MLPKAGLGLLFGRRGWRRDVIPTKGAPFLGGKTSWVAAESHRGVADAHILGSEGRVRWEVTFRGTAIELSGAAVTISGHAKGPWGRGGHVLP